MFVIVQTMLSPIGTFTSPRLVPLPLATTLLELSTHEIDKVKFERLVPPALFVSGERTEPHDRVAGLLIGGDDYIVKPFFPDELGARIRRLLVRSSVQPINDTASAGIARLTGREQQVLELLAEGLTQKAIANELYISTKTVGTHIQRILVKLGVHSRSEAVARAYRLGLVGADIAGQ